MNCRMLAVCGALLAVLSTSVTARGDVKIVSEVTVKGAPPMAQQPPSDKPTISTTYYKGTKQRIENEKSIIITDLNEDKIFNLDPAKKTYTVSSMKDIEKMVADNPMLSAITIDTDAAVTPGTETRLIAGKNAKLYNYTATLKMGMDGADENTSAMFPTITIKGEQWTTEEINAPITYQKYMQTTMARSMPAMMSKGIKGMVEKMAAVKGYPLSSVVTVSFTFAKNAPSSITSQIKEPIVTRTEVKSIAEAPLDDSLFTVPADYTEVKAPTSTGFPPPPGAQ